MQIYKNSDNNFVCKICNAVHLKLQDALDCSNSHGDMTNGKVIPEEQQLGPRLAVESDMTGYVQDNKENGIIKVSERLMMSLVEDYVIAREKDMKEFGTIKPMTFNLGKSAAEAVNNYNKIVSGSKSSSLNVNIDANKKSDLTALKEMLNITDSGDNE